MQLGSMERIAGKIGMIHHNPIRAELHADFRTDVLEKKDGCSIGDILRSRNNDIDNKKRKGTEERRRRGKSPCIMVQGDCSAT